MKSAFFSLAVCIFFVILVVYTATMDSVSAQDCSLVKGMKETACNNKIKAGCDLFWAGRGCVKTIVKNGVKQTIRFGDGGCKKTGFCDFKCKSTCEGNDCFWDSKEGTCSSTAPTYN